MFGRGFMPPCYHSDTPPENRHGILKKQTAILPMRIKMTCLELCAGAGGQALGLEQAGLEHLGLVELDKHCCATLRANRPAWNVIQGDLRYFDAKPYKGVDLVAAGLPCPPF